MKTLLPLLLAVATLGLALPAHAVGTSNGTQAYPPTNAAMANWETGWGLPAITGWDYVGHVNGAIGSGVYLGNGWVLTAAHVQMGYFTFELGGVNYAILPASVTLFGVADVKMFQIDYATLDLPPLTLGIPASGDPVMMIGYGGGKSWGVNTVDIPLGIADGADGSHTWAFNTHPGVTGAGYGVGGDSGGAGFVYNTTTEEWELAGIMIGVDGNVTYLTQVESYAAAIAAARSQDYRNIPEPGAWLLLLSGGAMLATGLRQRRG